MRDPNQIEHDNEAFARVANGALIVTGSAWAAVQLRFDHYARGSHKLPAIYNARFFPAAGRFRLA